MGSSRSFVQSLAWSLGVVAAVITISSVGYYLGKAQSKPEIQELVSKLEECKRHLAQARQAGPDEEPPVGETKSTSPTSTRQDQGIGPQQQGARPGSAQELPRELPVFDAEASSEFYPARNVLNDNISAGTWVARWISDDGETKGAWLELHLASPATITGLRIYMVIEKNGVGGQIRDATLMFGDGSSQKVRFPFENGWQEVKITPTKTEAVRIVVDSVYPGRQANFGVDVFEVDLIGLAGE